MTKTSPKSGQLFEEMQLREALFEAEEVLERMLVPFFVLGEMGRCMRSYLPLKAKKLELGVKKSSLTHEAMNTLREYRPDAQILSGKILMKCKGVPVEIRIIKKHLKYFKNPDQVAFVGEAYKLPNPWNTYWKVRGLIA